MKRICLLLMLTLPLVSCAEEIADPLAYQDGAFSVKAEISNGDENYLALIASAPAENGRESTLTICGGLLDGVTFGFGENTCLMLDGMKIPLDDPGLIMGAYEIVSMFEIDRNCFYGSSETDEGTVFAFTDDEGRVKYEVLLADSMPKRIRATLGDRVIIAEIDEFLPG